MEFTFTPNEKEKDPLKEFGKDLTKMAANDEIDPIIGREEEISRIITILSRKTKNNPVLIGEPGVGKTAIVEGLAQKIFRKEVPENLKDKTIIEISIGSLISGASFQGQFEKRIKDLLNKVEQSDGEIILFIDEIHTLIGAGKNNQGGMDAAQMLKPVLARGKIRIIGATTLDEYRKYIEKDSAMERRLQKVLVSEPTRDEAITIMRGLKDRLENFHKVRISDKALVASVDLSTRYISDRQLPDKAIDLIDEAAAGIQTEMNSKPEELRKIEKNISILKMEELALKKENEKSDEIRIVEIGKDLAKLEKDKKALINKWEDQKEYINKITDVRKESESLKTKLTRLQADGEFEKASEILYKEIPNKLKELDELKGKWNKDVNLVKEFVSEEEVAEVVSQWTKIPLTRLLKSEREKILSLPKHLSMQVKGQTDALKLVSEAIVRSKANINDPNKPIGSFIFMGPTGVGKTELARSLAKELFDSEKHMVRIDMSEYMEEHSVARLIGSPPGYVGYDDGGQLTEAIRKKPYSIVLFDEIEKAHPKVLDLLLQVLDDGKLTDSRGKLINFKNTIVIMTSNIGSELILENKKINALDLLKGRLRPEFINRIDEIIIFKSLSKESIKQITINELNKLSRRLNSENYYVDFSEKLVAYICENAYDPQFGARPIKRFIKNKIETVLAKDIISQTIKIEQRYNVTVNKNKIEYELPKLN